MCKDNESWLKGIREEIDRHKDQRPVLVFFTDLLKLDQFADHEQYGRSLKPNKLDQRVPQADRDRVVNIAMGGAGVVTLCTRDFGRGTDFMCHDEDVIEAGGVHVIQTFVSPQKTEEIQIKGRTARQDNPGSYCMVLLAPDLEALNISTQDVEDMESGKKALYGTIDGRRIEVFDQMYPESVKTVHRSMDEHKASTKYLTNLLKCTTQGAPHARSIRDFLLERNRCFDDDGSSADGRRVVVLLDATGSMYRTLRLVQNYLSEVFTRCFKIIADKLGQGVGFEMQLGIYRNYNVPTEDMFFSATDFASTPETLVTFLNKANAAGGWGREAIEIGFAHAMKMHAVESISQIIVVGDAPPNTRDDSDMKRAGRSFSPKKWKEQVYFDTVHAAAVDESIVVSTVYVDTQNNSAWRQGFVSMAANDGFVEDIDINNKEAGATLCYQFSKCILQHLSKDKGSSMVSEYEKLYGKGYL